MLLIEEVAIRLDLAGIGKYDPEGDTGDIYLGVLPITPIDVVSIFPRGGNPANPPIPYQETNATVQVIIRSANRLDGFTRGQSILASLNGANGSLIPDGMRVISCDATSGEPTDLGKNEANQYEWSINLSIDYYKQ